MSSKGTSSLEQKALLLTGDDIDCSAVKTALASVHTPFAYEHMNCFSNACKSIEQGRYDLVIVDVGLDPLPVLDEIKELLLPGAKAPFLILSSADRDDDAVRAVQLGAEDYIPKQYLDDVAFIERTINHTMERHRLQLGLESTRDRERFLTDYDQCTSLPNRFFFLDYIHQTINGAQRNLDKFALFFIDLDRFKNINDAINHSAGDEVLRSVADRMKTLIRESDTLARFGGDEFVLVINQSNDDHAMKRVAEKLIKAINEPIVVGKQVCNVGASIGVAYYPRHGHSPEGLVKNAGMAMYEAKKKGRNRVHFFSQELHDKKSHFFNIERALHEALAEPDKNFTLHYQPKVELNTDKIVSVEALIRWHHAKMGNIPPNQFIALAEDLGLIGKIDEWVLEMVCRKAKEWEKLDTDVYIGANISGFSFNQPNFVENTVNPLLKKYDIKGEHIELEITEGVLLSNTARVLQQLEGLKKLGIHLAIDDFGTGFSSLSYLNRFPIDTLKIDGCFICDESSDANEKALLRAIIALGKAMEMEIVAECVETEAQYRFLQSLECDIGQGYYWYKPSADWEPTKLP